MGLEVTLGLKATMNEIESTADGIHLLLLFMNGESFLTLPAGSH